MHTYDSYVIVTDRMDTSEDIQFTTEAKLYIDDRSTHLYFFMSMYLEVSASVDPYEWLSFAPSAKQ